jgi:tetrapyrrole methylase family protein/MazG family protein
VYHPDPEQDGFRALVEGGVNVFPITDSLPDGATLLLPVATGKLEALVQITDRLLAPGGCPWDREQTHESLKRYLLEEAYELFDRIDANDDAGMREELGDLVLQPLLHSAMKHRDGSFDIDAVANDITEKLIRRHPHVFGEATAQDTEAVLRQWDQIKSKERGDVVKSVLTGVPKTMPALQRAYEVSKRAGRMGFDWPNIDSIWDKVREEELELTEAAATGDVTRISEEFGDLIFALVNVARWLKVEPEGALREMVARFTARFLAMEAKADKPLTELTAREWDVLWNEAKAGVA